MVPGRGFECNGLISSVDRGGSTLDGHECCRFGCLVVVHCVLFAAGAYGVWQSMTDTEPTAHKTVRADTRSIAAGQTRSSDFGTSLSVTYPFVASLDLHCSTTHYIAAAFSERDKQLTAGLSLSLDGRTVIQSQILSDHAPDGVETARKP